MAQHCGKRESKSEYDRLYDFTDLKDAVMHRRVLFPTYREFLKHIPLTKSIGELIGLLDKYLDGNKPQARDDLPRTRSILSLVCCDKWLLLQLPLNLLRSHAKIDRNSAEALFQKANQIDSLPLSDSLFALRLLTF